MAAPNSSRREPCHRFIVLSAVVAAFLVSACRGTPSPAPQAARVSDNVWAVVDGREITRDDVEKAYRRMRDTSQPLSDEETLAAKLSLLNDLILQDILIGEGAHS